MKVFKKSHIYLLTPLLMFYFAFTLACGTKAPGEVAITLSDNNNLFGDANVADVIFCVTYKNSQGNDETLIFPGATCADDSLTTCSSATPECGFKTNESSFRLKLEGIPIDTDVSMDIFGRDTSGIILFNGSSSTFTNSVNTQNVSITLQAGSS